MVEMGGSHALLTVGLGRTEKSAFQAVQRHTPHFWNLKWVRQRRKVIRWSRPGWIFGDDLISGSLAHRLNLKTEVELADENERSESSRRTGQAE